MFVLNFFFACCNFRQHPIFFFFFCSHDSICANCSFARYTNIPKNFTLKNVSLGKIVFPFGKFLFGRCICTSQGSMEKWLLRHRIGSIFNVWGKWPHIVTWPIKGGRALWRRHPQTFRSFSTVPLLPTCTYGIGFKVKEGRLVYPPRPRPPA